MKQTFSGSTNGQNIKIAIVSSRFNEPLTHTLIKKTVHALEKNNVDKKNIQLFLVPGALEVPQTINKVLKNYQHDAIIGLGVVAQGKTKHMDHVVDQSISGIAQLNLKQETPIINGILGGTTEQLRERIEGKLNRGEEFAHAAIEMATLFKKI